MSKHKSKQYFDEQGNLIIKPYRLKDFCVIFDINANTLKRWMSKYPNDLGTKDGRYYSIKQVDFMIRTFGLPHKVNLAA